MIEEAGVEVFIDGVGEHVERRLDLAGTLFESNTNRTIVAANGDALSISTTVTGCGDGIPS